MRQENLSRINDWQIKSKHPHYIHYYFLVRDIQDAMRQYAKGDFLDLGCGNKPYESLYTPLTQTRVGCDVIQSDRNRVDVICPATQLAFPDNSFDSVLCTQVLEHVYEHDEMMKEIYRILRPGGHIILTVPFAWELHEEPYDFLRYTKHALKILFEKHGLEIDYIKPNGGKWAAVYQLRNNILFSSFAGKSLGSRLKKLFYVKMKMIKLRNHFAIWLDKKFRDEVFTLNYIVVAHKPPS